MLFEFDLARTLSDLDPPWELFGPVHPSLFRDVPVPWFTPHCPSSHVAIGTRGAVLHPLRQIADFAFILRANFLLNIPR